MTHEPTARPRLSRTVALAGFDECLRALVNLPDFAATPLRVRIKRLAREYRQSSPDVAFHSRRLKEMEDYMDTSKNRWANRRLADSFERVASGARAWSIGRRDS